MKGKNVLKLFRCQIIEIFHLSSSAKRQKMNENVSFSRSYEFDDGRDSSISMTIYEDDNDLTYFNKSSRNRNLNSSVSTRSPLAIINKTGNQIPGPSSSEQIVKVPSKFDDAYVRRLQPKECLPDPFQYLSDEILLNILKFLPKKALNRLAIVNERFSRIIQDETLWIQMDLGFKLLRKEAISKILCRGLVILRLAQAKIQRPIFEHDFDPVGFESKIQYLDLSMTSIDKPSLAQLLGVCRSLKKLSLEAVPIDIHVCRQIAQNKSLEVLNLTMCEGLNKTGVNAMVTSLQNLLALNISWTNLKTSCVTVIVENLTPSIMRLNIAGCRKSLIDKR